MLRPKARWCCFALKIEPIKEFLKQFPNRLVFDGIRREESKKRSKYPLTYNHRHFGLVIHPIIDWTAKQVEEYLKAKGLPINPVYEYGVGSWECWCGVYKRRVEFERLKEVCPELFAKLLELEREFRSGFAYAFSRGKPLYLREI